MHILQTQFRLRQRELAMICCLVLQHSKFYRVIVSESSNWKSRKATEGCVERRTINITDFTIKYNTHHAILSTLFLIKNMIYNIYQYFISPLCKEVRNKILVVNAIKFRKKVTHPDSVHNDSQQIKCVLFRQTLIYWSNKTWFPKISFHQPIIYFWSLNKYPRLDLTHPSTSRTRTS